MQDDDGDSGGSGTGRGRGRRGGGRGRGRGRFGPVSNPSSTTHLLAVALESVSTFLNYHLIAVLQARGGGAGGAGKVRQGGLPVFFAICISFCACLSAMHSKGQHKILLDPAMLSYLQQPGNSLLTSASYAAADPKQAQHQGRQGRW
jgi:hypothetical protein